MKAVSQHGVSDFHSAVAEGRESRRERILAAAREALKERRISEVSLNEISRRTDLSRSKIERSFSSREAIFLELTQRDCGAWVDEVTETVEADVGADDPVAELSAVLASIVRRPLLCELLGCSSGIFELKAGVDYAVDYKTAMYGHDNRLGAAIESRLGPIPERLCTIVVLGLRGMVTELWAHAHPARAAEEAVCWDGGIGPSPESLEEEASQGFAVLLAGVVARLRETV